ncbi:MAG: hypothetical protein MUF00_16405 [Gemmatimonadaceae bacterium]|nr:hypothetical protein [Gemmatimonadaceae bacterium]
MHTHLIHAHNGYDTGPDIVDGLARAMVAFALDPAHRRQMGQAARASACAVDEAHELDALDARLRRLCTSHAARAA